MSDEFDSIPESRFSSFVPLTIFLAGFLLWLGIQDYSLNGQRAFYDQQINAAMPKYNEARVYADRYTKLLKDLIDTAQKDPDASKIVKEAMQAGWITFQPNATNSTGTPAQPAPPAPAPAK
jgi:hypothetical protein